MNEIITVKVLRDFYKVGTGEEARGLAGDFIDVSPALAEWLAERNLVEVVIDADDPEK